MKAWIVINCMSMLFGQIQIFSSDFTLQRKHSFTITTSYKYVSVELILSLFILLYKYYSLAFMKIWINPINFYITLKNNKYYCTNIIRYYIVL